MNKTSGTSKDAADKLVKNIRRKVTLSGKAPLDIVCVSALNTVTYAQKGLQGEVRKCYPDLNHAQRRGMYNR